MQKHKKNTVFGVFIAAAMLVSAGLWACDSCGCSSHAEPEKVLAEQEKECTSSNQETCTATKTCPITQKATANQSCTANQKKACSVAHGCTAGKNIVETAVSAGQFNTLATALKAAGLVEALQGKGPFTVFAPTDNAFAKLPKGTIEKLLKPENRGLLTSILTYHVVPGNVTAAQVSKLSNAKTLNGQQVNISVSDCGVKVDNAKVVKADISTTNGTIHVIDSVILPNDKDIVDVAVSNGSFNTLVAAVKAAGLAETLKAKGPFTVLAPTDKAFSKLPEGTVASLLKPENRSKLQAILKYHVLSGRVFAADALAARKVKTLQGTPIRAKTSSAGVTINNAKVTQANIDASNGVIHVIDRVLLPGMNQAKAHRQVRHTIITAINHGSNLYNSGHHKACADLYMKTANNIMTSAHDSVCSSLMQRLKTAMNTSKKTECNNPRAGTMRRALDDTLAAISE
jgi:uncharacterized surface protein with fasciclin (FAS1) repeats